MKNQKTNPNLEVELLKLVGTFHTLTTPILIGFFSLLNITSKETQPIATKSSANFFIGIFVGIGLLLYFVTFWVLFNSYDKDKNKLIYEKIRNGFIMSMVTSIIFIILIISKVFFNL